MGSKLKLSRSLEFISTPLRTVGDIIKPQRPVEGRSSNELKRLHGGTNA